MSGQVVGNYKLVEKIGEGGMGAVFRGVDLMLEREVAVKVLRPELASQPQVVERFRSEAITLAKLNHPNIATLYSFFRQSNDYFMVLEFVRGETLDKLMGVGRPMPCEQALALFSQALEGIEHAHRFGIVHRDIKPGNMMLTETGTLKVLDFGIARVLGTARMTRAGHLIGTVEYMSPEQVRGQETDARSDIYSLGLLLYEMLTGRVPFTSDSEFDLMKSQVEDVPPPPRTHVAHLPEEIERAILRALSKKPEERFQTAGEFRAALVGDGVAATTAFNYAAARATSPLSQGAASLATPPPSAPVSTPPPLSGESLKETRFAPLGFVVAPPPAVPVSSGVVHAEPAPSTEAIPQAVLTAPEAHPAGSGATAAPPPRAVLFGLSGKVLAIGGGALALLLVGGVALLLLLAHALRKPSGDAAGAGTAETARAAAPASPTPTPAPADPTPPQGMVYVRGGEFEMGRDDGDDYGKPEHRVSVSHFFIDKYEVKNEDYAKFVKEMSHAPPQTWKNGAYPEGAARLPVTGVTWDDASAYAAWAHKRLPTEEEWEFAARGEKGLRYPWGDEWQDGMANANSVSKGVVEVGKFQGASPFGAYDMIGNAWEWTATDMAAYPGGSLPQKLSTGKVIRGGCYSVPSTNVSTTLRRGWLSTGAATYADTGFRCAQDVTNVSAVSR
ncbi:MAG: SUMF1/EgtB/PvdO family nonheme iron enzyme [Acidobacteria bacterium]|nr:SUMF1/EgtB/PvdO family nonheme iron enzyme [Acidobacteriota bacterium]